jgi:hypothetical protein
MNSGKTPDVCAHIVGTAGESSGKSRIDGHRVGLSNEATTIDAKREVSLFEVCAGRGEIRNFSGRYLGYTIVFGQGS